MSYLKNKFHYQARFIPEAFYHVYGRTNNKERLFRSDENRLLFLNRFLYYLKDFVDVFAWCLMDNHYHFLIRVKDEASIEKLVSETPDSGRTQAMRRHLATPEEERDFHPVIERQFKRLFNSYARSFNKEWNRTGHLFHRPFKRVFVMDYSHLIWLVYYIHMNPVKHRILPSFFHYRWSSYLSFLSTYGSTIKKEEVLEWFGGLEEFIQFHQGKKDFPENTAYLQMET